MYIKKKKKKTWIQKDTCTLMFLAVLFRVVKTEKQTKCPLTLEWIKKMWYTHTHTHTHTHTCVCVHNGILLCHRNNKMCHLQHMGGLGGFPGDLDGKEFACSTGDKGLISGSGRSPWEGNGKPLQYSYLENPMDRDRQILYGIPCM